MENSGTAPLLRPEQPGDDSILVLFLAALVAVATFPFRFLLNTLVRSDGSRILDKAADGFLLQFCRPPDEGPTSPGRSLWTLVAHAWPSFHPHVI